MRVFRSSSSVCMCAKSLQVCPTLSDPLDCSLPRSSVHGIFSRQGHWSRLPFLLQGIFLAQGSNPHVLTFPALAGRPLPLVPPGKPLFQGRSPLIVIAWGPGPRQFPALPYPEVSELSVLPYFYLHSGSKAPGGNRVCCPFPRGLKLYIIGEEGLHRTLPYSGAYSPPTGLHHQESLSLVSFFFLNLSHQYPV